MRTAHPTDYGREQSCVDRPLVAEGRREEEEPPGHVGTDEAQDQTDDPGGESEQSSHRSVPPPSYLGRGLLVIYER